VKAKRKIRKQTKQLVGVFLAQAMTLVGDEPWQFRNLEDLCKWLVNECGAEAFTAPPGQPFADIGQINGSSAYRDILRERFIAWGGPLIRFENHIGGQRQLLHPAQLARFSIFAPETFPTHRGYESAASMETEKVVEASAKMDFDTLVDFSGNRGDSMFLYPWSPYPVDLRMKILLLVYLKHRKVFKLCARLKVKRCFELHAGSDIRSPYLLYLLREIAKILDPEVADWIKANADASHPTLYGDNAAAHFRFLYQHDLLGANHLKDGQVQDVEVAPGEELHGTGPLWLEGGSLTGDFGKAWSNTRRRFVSFGTGDADWERIRPILAAEHARQERGLPLVVELECSRFKDMRQAAKIAIENARRFRDGKPLLDADKLRAKRSPGGDWEQFATGNYSVEEVLAMEGDEIAAVRKMMQRIRGSKKLMALL
jgi:sugar phosphate isomerase/epimerase